MNIGVYSLIAYYYHVSCDIHTLLLGRSGSSDITKLNWAGTAARCDAIGETQALYWPRSVKTIKEEVG